MSEERKTTRFTLEQALTRCAELPIAQRQYAEAKKKGKPDFIVAVGGIVGIVFGVIALVCGAFTFAPGAVLFGGIVLVGGVVSARNAARRLDKLEVELVSAKARLTGIKSAMFDDYRHVLKTIAEASPSAPPLDAVADTTAGQLATPATPAGTAERQTPAADSQPVRPAAAASQTSAVPAPA